MILLRIMKTQVWDKSDGYDPDNFNPRTFFYLHDKNGDGYLDYYESETFFLHDLDKLYNTSDPNVDMWERSEELERMRHHMLEVCFLKIPAIHRFSDKNPFYKNRLAQNWPKFKNLVRIFFQAHHLYFLG